jgi:hypothetical protein
MRPFIAIAIRGSMVSGHDVVANNGPTIASITSPRSGPALYEVESDGMGTWVP